MKSKILSSLLTLCLILLCLTILPDKAQALSGTIGTDITWELENEVLTITGTGPLPDYSERHAPWRIYDLDEDEYCSPVFTKLIVGEGITELGEYAFYNAESLTEVSLPSTLTQIDSYAFCKCGLLESINIPETVTAIMPYTFARTSLKQAPIPNSITSIGDFAFAYCSKLTDVTLPDGLTTIGREAFRQCQFTAISIPDSVTTIGDAAFLKCTKLTSVKLPAGLTELPTSIFDCCTKLPSIQLPQTLTKIGIMAFHKCYALTSVVIPESVTEIGGGAFMECDTLEQATLPQGLTYIPNSLFSDCLNLKGIDIPEGVESIGASAFYDCKLLTQIDIPQNVTAIGQHAFSGCTGLAEIVIPEGVTTLGRSAFWGCKNLTTVKLPSQLKEIGEGTFQGCRVLTNVVIPRSVTRIEARAFADTGIQEVELAWHAEHVGDEAFLNCTQLKTITIVCDPDNVSVSAFSGVTATVYYPQASVTWDQENRDSYQGNLTWQAASLPAIIEQTLWSRLYAKPGEYVTVTCNAVGEGLTYEWYYRNEGETEFRKTNTFKSGTYRVKMAPGRNGRTVYCVVTDKNGYSKKSYAVTLDARCTLTVSSQPQTITVKKGELAEVSVVVTGEGKRYGLTYEWYYRDGEGSMKKTNSFSTNRYYVTMNEARDGRYLCCVISDKFGNKVETQMVRIFMEGESPILHQPQSITVAKGEQARVIVSTKGEVRYQWFYANKGSDEFVKAKMTSYRYNVDMTAARDGRRVYCVVSEPCGRSYKTDVVTISMATTEGPKILEQPVAPVVPKGKLATVTVVASGEGLTYRWYYANSNSQSYHLLEDMTGATYAAIMDWEQSYRSVFCIVTDSNGVSLVSDAVTLRMGNPMVLTKQPVSVAVAEGEMAKVTVGVKGDDMTFKWYYADAGSDVFKRTYSFGGNSYSVAMNDARNGRRVYCVITDRYGKSITTDIVTISMI